MPKIPCKRCESCGRYHDIAQTVCVCGADLSGTAAAAVERETALAARGTLREELPVYVQKCSACGTENFTADPAKRVKSCRNCHKARVATVVPVLYVGADRTEAPEEEERETPEILPKQAESTPQAETDDAARWRGILGGVQSAVSAAGGEAADPVDEDEDEDEAPGWGDLLGGTAAGSAPAAVSPASVPPPVRKVSSVTFTALRYGSYSFTLKADDGALPLLVGRYAAHGPFLQRDGRVSGEHCSISFRGGSWYVTDNHSTNGTAVNGRFLPINGEQVLRDGDELMLGHHADSMAFRVRVE